MAVARHATPEARAAYLARARAASAMQRDRMGKIKRAAARREPTVGIQPTVASLAGHFAGDGCVLSSGHGLNVLSATLDVTKALERQFGGSVRKSREYFVWRLPRQASLVAALELLPYAWGKQDQLSEFLGARRADVLAAMKAVPSAVDDSAGLAEEVVAGFLGADGHVTVRGTVAVFSPYIVFSQKHRPVLDAIALHFPGGSRVGDYMASCQTGVFHTHQLSYSGAAAAELIRRVEPFVTVSYKRSICRAILDMPRDQALAEHVWGLLKANKDLPGTQVK